MTAPRATDERARDQFRKARLAKHPHFVRAVVADTRYACALLSRPIDGVTRGRLVYEALRLAIVSDAFIGLVFYRAKARLQALGVPLLPYVAHRLAIASAGVAIGNPVLVEPGIYLPHGQVVIDGMVNIGAGCAIRPWVTIGLVERNFQGPTIGRDVRIGTGAKILGPVVLGDGASIGANAVVMIDVPPGATAVGVPARVVGRADGVSGGE
jgi:serine O-acetyltransferase